MPGTERVIAFSQLAVKGLRFACDDSACSMIILMLITFDTIAFNIMGYA
jgi:hypothetical protein